MNCPKCNNSTSCKDGKANGKQRYFCRHCSYRYTVLKRSTEKTEGQKHLALKLYLEGMGFRAIGRVLGINFVTVYYWIKKWGESLELPKAESPIEIVELDEIHSYVQNKKTIVGRGLLLTDLENATSILFVENARQKHLKSYGKD